MYEELYHHGVKGMKWGVRRYRNKDGSMTNAGKKRYSENDKNSKTHTKSKIDKKTVMKAVRIGESVCTGVLTRKVAYNAIYQSTGNEMAAIFVGGWLGTVGGMLHYDWLSR